MLQQRARRHMQIVNVINMLYTSSIMKTATWRDRKQLEDIVKIPQIGAASEKVKSHKEAICSAGI